MESIDLNFSLGKQNIAKEKNSYALTVHATPLLPSSIMLQRMGS